MPERSQLNDGGALPESSASTRVDGGKLVGASAADLRRGYAPNPERPTIGGDPDEVTNTIFPEPGGFLGRPNGWDR
jgi:hypothetical protein